ncbi:MAG TPA: 2-oxo acid dehydrogenase subunit E2, partial [Anaerolineae bacterium]|nr:2-oxo acid dehydrogenase subunit E2 [Anaerolineae bacterium]
MTQIIGPYQVHDLPAARRDTPHFLDLTQARHSMYGLLEVDVTLAREFIEAHKARTGEALSFTGYLVFCLARAVDENKSVQAYLKGRKHLVQFDDVDVGMPIEREVGGSRAPMGHVIRRANHKTFLEIHQEIRAVQTGPVPPNKGVPSWVRFILLLPWPLPTLFIALLRAARRRDPAGPAGIVPTGGTVAVTAVGMFGKHSGWGVTPTVHSLMLIVGGIARKPGLVGDRVEPREMLSL